MNDLADIIKSILLSRQAIGVVLIVFAAAAILTNRPFFRDVWNDPSAFWRTMARMAATLGAVTLAWVTLFDDWLQIIAEPYRATMQWEYQRVVLDPVDPTIRAISYGLIAATLLAMGCLFARHVGGYLMQIGTLVLATLVWMPLFIINQRLNALIVQGAEASDSLLEVLGLSVFWLVRISLGALTIAATLTTLMMLLTLAATVVLDLLKLREVRVTHEADGFFSELGKRADQHEDVPLKALWKPIRRPS